MTGYLKFVGSRKARFRRAARSTERHIITDKEWKHRCAIGAGVMRGRLARKIVVALNAHSAVGDPTYDSMREVVLRVLKEEGY